MEFSLFLVIVFSALIQWFTFSNTYISKNIACLKQNNKVLKTVSLNESIDIQSKNNAKYSSTKSL